MKLVVRKLLKVTGTVVFFMLLYLGSSLVASAADEDGRFTLGGVTYQTNEEDNNVYVYEILLTAGQNVTIPEQVEDGSTYTVTEVGYRAAAANETLRSISLPTSIVNIMDGAFYECTNLQTVNFNGNTSMLTIGSDAFWYCSNLLSITIPDTVTTIGSSAFYNCQKLTSVILPTQSYSAISEYTFSECKGLTAISIPACIGTIEKEAFSGTGFKILTIPDTISTIGNGAFSDCLYLESINLPKNQYYNKLEEYLFQNSTKLNTVIIPDNINEIGQYCFSNSGLTNLVISDKVTTIGRYAFNNCSKLKCVQFLSQTVPSIPSDSSLFQSITKAFTIVTPIGTSASYSKDFADNSADLPTGCLFYESNTVFSLFPSLSGSLVQSMEGNKIYYGEALSKVRISGNFVDQNGSPVAGTLTWQTPNVKLKPGSHSPVWSFTPTASNALPITGTESVYIQDKIIYVSPAAGQYKVKGAAEPVYQFTYTPLENGDIMSMLLMRASGENVGSYDFYINSTAVTYADSNDYDCYDFILVTNSPKFSIIQPGATSMTLNTSGLTLGKGEKFSIKATLAPVNSGDSLTFVSSKKSVAIVSASGVITAKGNGTCIIKLTSRISGISKSIKVAVKKAPGAKQIKLNVSTKKLNKGNKFTIKVIIAKGYASMKRTFSSSNKSVAIISSKGVITAKKSGKTTISVKTFNGKVKKVKITVK